MQKVLLCIVLILALGGCKRFKSEKDIQLEIRGHGQHFLLTVKNFDWSYGTIEIAKFKGDFATLDRMVYDSLRVRDGDCIISIANATTNKYGTIDSSKTTFGILHMDELHKYQTWEYWHKDGGIAKMIHEYYSRPPLDSARMDTVQADTLPSNPMSDTTIAIKQSLHTRPLYASGYRFDFDELYPTMKPNTDPADRYIINGTIGEIHFDYGEIEVTTTDGDSIIVEFPTTEVSAATSSRLEQSLKYGNDIRCVAYKLEPGKYRLLAAKIK